MFLVNYSNCKQLFGTWGHHGVKVFVNIINIVMIEDQVNNFKVELIQKMIFPANTCVFDITFNISFMVYISPLNILWVGRIIWCPQRYICFSRNVLSAGRSLTNCVY